MRKRAALIGLLVVCANAVATIGDASKTDTALGLYVTASEAYEMWQADEKRLGERRSTDHLRHRPGQSLGPQELKNLRRYGNEG